MKAVIIAAGMGSRLWDTTDNTPKTLLPFGSGTILSAILSNFQKAGIHEFVIVVGYKQEYITGYFNKLEMKDISVSFAQNPDWKKGNAISVLTAAEAVGNESFILSMCDHVVSPDALKKIINSDSSKNLLLVDPKPEECFDIDDATKVLLEGNRITDIGKEINKYNGIDCGIFRLNSKFFEIVRMHLSDGKDSISHTVNGLIADNDMEAVFTGESDYWIDIDTPEAYDFALKHYAVDYK